MYKEFYLMKKEPFDSHPSPDLFYKSGAHQNGWSYLIHGIRKDEPILLVAGDYGAGKTLLYLKLIRQLKKSSHYSHVSVPTPTYNFVMVLEKIIETLIGIKPDNVEAPDELKLQQAIYEYFETQLEGKKSVIYVVIDDAQEFSYTFLNKLRLFASYNYDGIFPIRIIMFAHKSFLKMLGYKKLIAFGQRIKRIYQLDPLGFEETREYIYYRLIHSGATGTPVFDDDAIKLIQETSHGNPRLINNICDNCLLVSCNDRSNLIDRPLVQRALQGGNLMGIVDHLPETDQQSHSGRMPNGYPVGEPPQQMMPIANAGESAAPPAAAPAQQPYPQTLPAPEYHHPEPPAAPMGPGGQPAVVYPPPADVPVQPPYMQGESPAYPEANAYASGNLGQGMAGQPAQSVPQGEAPQRIEASKKTGVKTMPYGKIGIIAALLLMILFLLFYVLQKDVPADTAHRHDNSPIISKPVPEPQKRYPIDKGRFDESKNQIGRATGKQQKETYGDDKQFHPLLVVEK